MYFISSIIFVGKTQQIQTTNKIADSFPGMDGYVQAPVPQQNLEPVSVDLTKPPKWLKRPVGANFGVSLCKEFLDKNNHFARKRLYTISMIAFITLNTHHSLI